MLHIKKYANGRFFDTDAKEYVSPEKLAEMIKEGEGIQVTLAKTGKDITDTVIGQFSENGDRKPGREKRKIALPFLKTANLKTATMTKWMRGSIDTGIEKLMGMVRLPSREQVAILDENIRELNKKIDALELSRNTAADRPEMENGNNNSLAAVLSTAS